MPAQLESARREVTSQATVGTTNVTLVGDAIHAVTPHLGED